MHCKSLYAMGDGIWKAFAMFLFIYCFMFPAMDVYYLYNKKVIKIKHKIVLLENYSPNTSMIPALLVIRCSQRVDSYPGKKMNPSCSFVNSVRSCTFLALPYVFPCTRGHRLLSVSSYMFP